MISSFDAYLDQIAQIIVIRLGEFVQHHPQRLQTRLDIGDSVRDTDNEERSIMAIITADVRGVQLAKRSRSMFNLSVSRMRR